MKFYHYNPITREFSGVSLAQKNQKEKGKYLQPAFSLKGPPPEVMENECAIERNGAWAVVPNFVGVEYWLEDGSKHTIKEIGDLVPEEASLVEIPAPEIVEPPTHEQIRDAAWLAQTYEPREGVLISVRPPMVRKYDADVLLGLLRKIRRGNSEFGEVTDVNGVKQLLSEAELELAVASHDEQTEANYNIYYEAIQNE